MPISSCNCATPVSDSIFLASNGDLHLIDLITVDELFIYTSLESLLHHPVPTNGDKINPLFPWAKAGVMELPCAVGHSVHWESDSGPLIEWACTVK
ncbi:hypothetical protein ACTXT7_006815 [Hymenolepis weldensis]